MRIGPSNAPPSTSSIRECRVHPTLATPPSTCLFADAAASTPGPVAMQGISCIPRWQWNRWQWGMREKCSSEPINCRVPSHIMLGLAAGFGAAMAASPCISCMPAPMPDSKPNFSPSSSEPSPHYKIGICRKSIPAAEINCKPSQPNRSSSSSSQILPRALPQHASTFS